MPDNSFFLSQNIDEEDERAMQNFMNQEPTVRRTLADVIMEKINEKKTEIESHMSGACPCSNRKSLIEIATRLKVTFLLVILLAF